MWVIRFKGCCWMSSCQVLKGQNFPKVVKEKKNPGEPTSFSLSFELFWNVQMRTEMQLEVLEIGHRELRLFYPINIHRLYINIYIVPTYLFRLDSQDYFNAPIGRHFQNWVALFSASPQYYNCHRQSCQWQNIHCNE